MKLLVVDDHAPTLTFMRLALTAAGHDVHTEITVSDALVTVAAAAGHDPFDIVLSDLTFADPDADPADGQSLARSLRSEPATSSVGLIAVTGVHLASDLDRARSSGFDAVVAKPVELPILLDQIDRFASPADQ